MLYMLCTLYYICQVLYATYTMHLMLYMICTIGGTMATAETYRHCSIESYADSMLGSSRERIDSFQFN